MMCQRPLLRWRSQVYQVRRWMTLVGGLLVWSAPSAETLDGQVDPPVKLTLQDDPAFQPQKYAKNVQEDPECNRDPLWGPFRQVLMAAEPENRIELAYEKTIEWGLENATIVDEQAKICIIGLITLQFLFARFLLTEVNSVEAAAHSFRLMDSQTGALHPDVFDKASGYGKIWPITADEVDSLRRGILKSSVGGGSGGPDRRRRFKNAFGLHDGDWNEVWGSWRPQGKPVGTVGPKGFGAAQTGAPKPSFRVYVYDPDEHPSLRKLARGAAFCKHNQWGMEVALHDWFLSCPCRTDNPDEADFFFVPHYTACLINHADTFTGCDTKQLCGPSTELFEQVLNNSRHYKRTDGGRDHLFVWGSGMGAEGAFASWRQWVPNAVFLMTETELWNPFDKVALPSFSPHKDIVVPGRITIEDMISLGKLARPLEERDFLGHFIGWPRPPHPSAMSKESCKDASCALNVRSVLLALKGNDSEMHVDVDVPYMESFLGLTSSLFCFVPRGKSAWSSRFFQTYFAGCIPVLLNDRYEPPFGEIVDIPSSTIKWPMTEVPALVSYLRTLRDEQPEIVYELQRAGQELKCWYAWPSSWVEWSWIELNRSKFNSTCSAWHVKNAYVAVTRLLAAKATSSRHRFYYPGASPEVLERPGALPL
ncbi:unnamed protein product [Polarella glacialis]|uniref:Exostosin GT47 domain-containing protein n=1 Tax=Polarella glacialis TaxID=89957 RepID=A0A813IBD5_POLGL|nr:unnamed protein product [Polarella glacialis]